MTSTKELQWTHLPCDGCGSLETDLVFEGPDRLHHLPGIFQMKRCPDCGLFRQDPCLRWESLSSYYPEEYAAYNYTTGGNDSPLRRRLNNYGNVKRRHFVEKFQHQGRLLEVGCGTGAFLREMASSGKWQLEGLEPSPSAVAFASKTLGIPVHPGRLSEVSLEPASYEAIVLWCVLEHLIQPVQDLRHIHSLLKKGGWLFLSIPNAESLALKLFGPFWSGWDLPRHIYVFPRPVLRKTLGQMGFGNFHERCISTSYASLGHSLDFWSQSWQDRHPRLRQGLLAAYKTWAARLALSLPLALLDRLNLSTNITLAAQKLD